jgi:hypothetical protein
MYWSAGAIYSTANEMVQWYDNLFAGNIINQSSLQQMTYFDKATWYGLGVQFLSPPGLPDDEVDGFGGTVPGYTSEMGYDVKGRGSLCLLANQGVDVENQILSVLVPLVIELCYGYTRRQDDAGITKIVSPLSEKCEGTFSPEVLLQNFGSSNLQSVKINYQVDNGAINSYNWTGNLVTDATVVVTLPAVSAPGGNHSFKAFTSGPNGNAEGYNYNDAASSKFTINNGPFATSIDEGFEGAAFPAGWQNGNNTPFDWGQTSVGYFADGSNKGVVKNNADDGTKRSYDLELPYLNLTEDNNPVLSFDYAYGFDKNCPSCVDELTVLVSKDCGKTYHPVFNRKGQALKTSNTNTLYYPKSNEWGSRTINLSAYQTNVLIKFRITSGFGNLIYLDNIKVGNVSAMCQSPTDLDEVKITGSSSKLNWKFGGNSDHFDLFYRPKTSASWIHKTVAGTKQSTDIGSLLPNTDYEWYITAACKEGNSVASAKSYFTTGTAVAAIASTLQNKTVLPGSALRLTVYPNPTSSSCTVSFSLAKSEKVSLKIFDMQGKLISHDCGNGICRRRTPGTLEFNEHSWGVYVLKMDAESFRETKKLIVVK